MNALVKTLFVAATTAAASRLLARWLDARNASRTTLPRPVEHWENEGGAVLPVAGVAPVQHSAQ